MKKLFCLTAIVSLLFAGCNNDNENYDPNDPSTETVRLLPSKWISSGGSSPDTIRFLYDNLNRLEATELWRRHGLSGGITITYNVNDNPIATDIWCRGQFRYSGNFVFVPRCGNSNWSWSYDTLTISVDGRLDTRKVRNSTTYLSYNSSGNLIKIVERHHAYQWMEEWSDTTEIFYSNVRSIWRHINIPEWFLAYLAVNDLLTFPVEFACKRMMPARIKSSRSDGVTEINFAYRLDANGYVVQMDETRTSRWTDWDGTERIESRTIVHTIEWIPAR